MKKVVVLNALLLFSVLCIPSCAANNNLTLSADVKHANDTQHTITVTSDESVVVNVSETAITGEVVNVSLTYDESLIIVDDVLVNGLKASRTSSTSFTFVMPDADVSLTVSSRPVNPDAGKHSITNESADKGVVLVGLPSLAFAGEVLSFKVEFTPLSGYTFTDKVEIHQLNSNGEKGETVSVNNDSSLYSFTMPDADISIAIGTEERHFLITKDSATSANIDKIEASNDGETYESINASTMLVRYNQYVRVTLKHTASRLVTGIKLAETKQELMLENESLELVFRMPGQNLTLSVLSEIIYKPITLVNSENVSLTLVTKGEDDTWVDASENKGVPGDYVYVRATSLSPDTHQPNKPIVNYNNGYSLSVYAEDEANHIYYFRMPEADDTTITATEIATPYKAYAFYGESMGANIDVNSISSTYQNGTLQLGSSYSLTNDGSATVKKGTSSYVIDSLTGDQNAGLLKLKGQYSSTASQAYAYGKQFGYGYYNLNMSNFDNPDAMVTFKTPAGRTYSEFEFKYLAIRNSSSTDRYADYLLVQAYDKTNSTVYAQTFIDYSVSPSIDNSYKTLNDITFEFNEGASLLTDTAITSIVVKQGENTLLNVTSDGSAFTASKPTA